MRDSRRLKSARAVRNLKTAQTQSFSIHNFGEWRSLAANDLQGHDDDPEKTMLENFYKFVRDKREYNWRHWNLLQDWGEEWLCKGYSNSICS